MKKPEPLLAALVPKGYDLDALEGPFYGTPKIDGIRCLNHPINGPLSRSFKPIPNVHIAKTIADLAPAKLDGEIRTYTNGIPDDFNTVQSKVMSRDGRPEFEFQVFDYFPTQADLSDNYRTFERVDAIHQAIPEPRIQLLDDAQLVRVPQQLLTNGQDIAKYVDEQLDGGFEGVCLRHARTFYKFGKSTLLQRALLKIKPLEDAEGVVIGTEERMHNANEAKKDAFGRQKRSSHKANMIPMNTLGKFILRTQWGILKVGTGKGLTDQLRDYYWSIRESLIGHIVTFSYQEYGMKDLPRAPIWKGIRHPDDIT